MQATPTRAPVRTLEHRLKFDHGLTIGQHLVRITHADRSVLVLVEISPRGIVRYLKQPGPGDMYSAWSRLRGDIGKSEGPIYVYAVRSEPELMARFQGEPVATVPVLV